MPRPFRGRAPTELNGPAAATGAAPLRSLQLASAPLKTAVCQSSEDFQPGMRYCMVLLHAQSLGQRPPGMKGCLLPFPGQLLGHLQSGLRNFRLPWHGHFGMNDSPLPLHCQWIGPELVGDGGKLVSKTRLVEDEEWPVFDSRPVAVPAPVGYEEWHVAVTRPVRDEEQPVAASRPVAGPASVGNEGQPIAVARPVGDDE